MKKVDLSDMQLYCGAVAPGTRSNRSIMECVKDNPAWVIRAKCPSGVQIKFRTDAEKLLWQCSFTDAAREIYTTDIAVDDKLFTFDGPGLHELALAAGKKCITIHLPHLVNLADYALLINQAACIEPLPRRKKLLICGDSILQGMTCSSPTRASVAITAEALDMDLHNTAIGGVIMDDKLLAAALETGGDMVVTGLGINDTSHNTPHDLFRRRTAETLRLLTEYGKPALLITPIPTTMSDVEPQRRELVRIILEEAEKYPAVNILVGDSFFPQDDALLCDKLHPNDAGMHVYASGLIQALRQLADRV